MSRADVQLTVVKGRNLAPKDRTGLSDPYLKITAGNKKKKTKKILQNLNPEWNETFIFNDLSLEAPIECVCMDWDHHGRDFMGQFFISKEDLHKVFEGPQEKWFPLQKRSAKDEISGEILIRTQLVLSVTSTSEAASLSALHPLPSDRYESQHIHCPLLKKVTAQYDFDAEQIGEISIKAGETMEVFAEEGEWYEGKRTDGQRGWFPITYAS
eukprot:TRINITY_DN6154_c0_g1_i1.p1 TRINITY_DN6154_c0_g1~~TRINITY_DN6154_c0_g1_i1.p1  ORF type:complete len:212 (+),score=8.44 TRINITY_DN6154_c0_g1_i1:112-747(+)